MGYLLCASCVTVTFHCAVKPASDITLNLLLLFLSAFTLTDFPQQKKQTEEVENFMLYYA